MDLDTAIARLQSIPSFNVYEVDGTGGVQPWYEITGSSVIKELVVRDADLLEQVQVVSAQIGHWGRLVSLAKRVWEVEERKYRIWRSQKELDKAQVPEGTKKPPKTEIDAMIRVDPEYPVRYAAIERAEEAYEAARSILEGFRAKKDIFKSFAIRRNEDGAASLGV